MPPGINRFPMNINSDMDCPGPAGKAAIDTSSTVVDDNTDSPREADERNERNDPAKMDTPQGDDNMEGPWQQAPASKKHWPPKPSIEDEAPSAKSPSASAQVVDEPLAATTAQLVDAGRKHGVDWNDSESDEDFDPYPNEGRPAEPIETGIASDFLLDRDVFVERSIVDGDIVFQINGEVLKWDRDAEQMVSVSDSQIIRTSGPQYAPGMQAIAEKNLQLPQLNILRGADCQEDFLRVDAKCLQELMQHWRATQVGDATEIAEPAPDDKGLVRLDGKLTAMVIEAKDRDIEMLKGTVAELRRDRADHLLRDPRMQRYTLEFVKDKLVEVRRKQKALQEAEQDLERQRDALDAEKAKTVQVQQEARFCNMRQFEAKLDEALQALQTCVDEEGTFALEKWEELYGSKFTGYLDVIEKALEELRESVADVNAAREKLRVELEKSATAQAETVTASIDVIRKSEEVDTRIAQGAASAVKAWMQVHEDASVADRAKTDVLLRSAELEDEATLRAEQRMCFIAELDPGFIMRTAKAVALRQRNNKLIEWHRLMIKDPKGLPQGKKGTHVLGFNVGIWLRANDGARLKDPASEWYGAKKADHELSLHLSLNPTKDMPYWQGLDEGIAWAGANAEEAAKMVDKVTL